VPMVRLSGLSLTIDCRHEQHPRIRTGRLLISQILAQRRRLWEIAAAWK
jgi:hypothetical protein